MRRPVAVFDANVLYPAFLRDLLVRLALAGVVAPRWTERIHEEWMRNVLAKHPDLDLARLLRTRDLMERAAPGALVEGYEHHVGRIHLPDPDDRHVVAAAIEAGADLIITFNLRDFPSDVLASFGVIARHPDAFVVEALERAPRRVLAAMRAQRAGLNRPVLTGAEYIQRVAKAGLIETAECLGRSAPDL